MWNKLTGSSQKAQRRNLLMRIEKITRHGKEFGVLPMDDLKKLMEDAEMLADVKAYDTAKARIERAEDELIPFAMAERRVAGESPARIWRKFRGFTQEVL
jgi:hypothetical protein